MRFLSLVIAGLGLSLALGGCAAGLSSTASAQRTTPVSASPTPTGPELDRDFVNGMLAHHQVAVEMAQVEVQQGKRADVKQLAQQIIDDQQREIQEMQQIARQELNFTPSPYMALSGNVGTLMGEPILMDMAGMPGEVRSASDVDRTFLQLMIPHHSMAIVMADTEVRFGQNARLKSMGQSIVTSQAQQVGEMERLLVGS